MDDDTLLLVKNKFQEVQIPVPWGQISGKWWGKNDADCSNSKTPILAIHGWQDNAGTFDNLAELLLDKGHCLFCIDLPGHGLSSHYPKGMPYYLFWDGIKIVRRITKFFKWSRITLIGHSLGGIISFLYAATYPEDVEKYVTIDILSPVLRTCSKAIDALGFCVDQLLHYEISTVKPTYTFAEMEDIIYNAHKGSLTKESTRIMMRRGIKPCLDPDKKDHYEFTRDVRLKIGGTAFFTTEQVEEFASRIRCKVLFIRGDPGMKFPSVDHDIRIVDILMENAKLFRKCTIPGTHHLHLNDAPKLIGPIDEFLCTLD